MKHTTTLTTTLTTILTAAFAVFATVAATAQTLTVSAPGYTAAKLFETAVGETIGGLDFSGAGDVYYLVRTFGGTTKLQVRTPADGYSTSTTLHDFGSAVYGSFVTLHAGKLYYGENSAGTIRVHDISLHSDALLATVTNNYDLAIAPGGTGYLSENRGYAGNKASTLDLSSGGTSVRLTSLDYSGPVGADDQGRLYYGGTAFGIGGGIYRYSAAEVAAGGLTLDAGHQWVSNSNGNAYFAFNDAGNLWQTDFAGLGFFNTTTAAFTAIGSTTDSLGNLAADSAQLLASVTAYGASSSLDKSAVFRVVPEPASAILALAGLASLIVRRRRLQS